METSSVSKTVSIQHVSYLTRNLGAHTQHAVRGDGTSATAAIRPVGLDGELALLSWAHVKETLVPALDDLALSDREAEGLAAAVRSVELGAVGLEGSTVCGVLGDSLLVM